MLGSSRMVNEDQIRDCLARGWVVLSPNHRLCPQVNVLEGPMQDCRDLLRWIYDGSLAQTLKGNGKEVQLDLDRVYAMGTSSGGTLALALVSSTRGMSTGEAVEATHMTELGHLTILSGLRCSQARCSDILHVWSV